MEIKEDNIIKAYNTATADQKSLLRAMFPDIDFEPKPKPAPKPITERIKTLKDALDELGENHPYVQEWSNIVGVTDESCDLRAYLELRIICTALNEGWEPEFTEDEWRYYPWFYLYDESEVERMSQQDINDLGLMETGEYLTDYCGFAFASSNDAPSDAGTAVGSRLCLKSDTLARYCGRQFIKQWADFCLVRK